MEDEKIEVVRNWPKAKSIYNIQVFISFTNFYWQFICDFSKIAAPLISILKTTESSSLALRELRADDDEVVGSSSKVDDRKVK